MNLHIDNSKRSSFAACPRKYFYRYKHFLTSNYGSTALRYGSTWHGILEGYYSSILENGWDSDKNLSEAIALGKNVWEEESEGLEFFPDYRTLDNCYSSFLMYLEEYQADRHMKDILASERMFNIEMKLSPEEKTLLPYLADVKLNFTGKLDLEVSLGGQHWIEEFKSTGQPLSIQLDRLQRSAQILGYTWASRYLGHDIVGVLVSGHQLLSRKVKSGGYGKLTQKFARQPNVFSEADLQSWRTSYLTTCNQIAQAEETNNFPCQFDSCYQFGKCGFTSLCEQNKPLEDLYTGDYKVQEWDVLKSGSSKDLADTIILEG